MKKRLILAGILTLIVVGISAFFFAKRGKKSESIRTTGIVEGVEVNISPTVSGRILKECCKEGDVVTKGDTVLEIENDDLKASLEQALAVIEKAKAEVSVNIQ